MPLSEIIKLSEVEEKINESISQHPVWFKWENLIIFQKNVKLNIFAKSPNKMQTSVAEWMMMILFVPIRHPIAIDIIITRRTTDI